MVGENRRFMCLTLHQWLVFLSGYIVYGLSVGLFYSLGALFPVIMDTFDSTRAETSVIQSIYVGFQLGGGIFYGMLTSRLGSMKTALLGSIITSVSLLATFWTTSLSFLMVSSIFTASGLSMCFVSSTVGIRQFFEGPEAVVVLALISSSPGTSAIALTYLLQYLSDTFGIRGALLIIGGVELNCAALSLLWVPRTRLNKVKTASQNTKDKTVNLGYSIYTTSRQITGICSGFNCEKDQNRYPKDGYIDKMYKNKAAIHKTEGICSRNKENVIQNGYSNMGYVVEKTNNDEVTGKEYSRFEENSFKDDSDYFNDNRQQKDQIDAIEMAKMKLGLKAKFEYLLRNSTYIFTAIGSVFCISPLLLYPVFLLDMYQDHGYSSSQGAIGLTIMNIAAIFGRAAPAVIAHCRFYNTFLIPITSTILASIAITLLTCTTAPSIIMYHVVSGFIGFGQGVCISVLIVNISELVKTVYLSEAVGLILSIVGVFFLVGGPITGLLRDTSGSYISTKILTSVFIGLGSAMFVLAAYFQRKMGVQLGQKKHVSTIYITDSIPDSKIPN